MSIPHQSPELSTRWTLYTTYPEIWDALLAACASAQKSIDIEQFMFLDDEIGRKFIEVCSERAQNGVKVRFLWDAAGSFSLFGTLLVSELSQKGIQIRFFNTIIPRALHNHRWWFFRNHRRLIYIDGEVAFTGSYCIADKAKAWRDNALRIEGPLIKNMEKAFEIMWSRANNVKVDWGVKVKATEDGFRYITNAPVPRKQFLYHTIIDAIRTSQRYVYLTTPYFVPDRRLMRVLRLAAQRGVDVRLLLPHASDHPIVDLGARGNFEKLLSSGVRVFTSYGPFNHAKYIAIDDEWATSGTMNMDRVSLHYNFEGNIVSTDRVFTQKMREIFEADVASATEVDLKVWMKRPWTKKLLEFFVRFLREFL